MTVEKKVIGGEKDLPQEKKPQAVISIPQAKRFYAIAKEAGWSDDALKQYLITTKGIDSTKKILKWDYESLCLEIKKGPQGDPEGCTKSRVDCELSVFDNKGKAECNGKPCPYQQPELLHTKEDY